MRKQTPSMLTKGTLAKLPMAAALVAWSVTAYGGTIESITGPGATSANDLAAPDRLFPGLMLGPGNINLALLPTDASVSPSMTAAGGDA